MFEDINAKLVEIQVQLRKIQLLDCSGILCGKNVRG